VLAVVSAVDLANVWALRTAASVEVLASAVVRGCRLNWVAASLDALVSAPPRPSVSWRLATSLDSDVSAVLAARTAGPLTTVGT
jgi:hypothetical protein